MELEMTYWNNDGFNGMREPVPGTFGTLGSFSSNLVHFEIGTKYEIGTGTKNRTKIVEDF